MRSGAVVLWNGIGRLRRQRHWCLRVDRVPRGSKRDHWRVDWVKTLMDKRGYGGIDEGGIEVRATMRWGCGQRI